MLSWDVVRVVEVTLNGSFLNNSKSMSVLELCSMMHRRQKVLILNMYAYQWNEIKYANAPI